MVPNLTDIKSECCGCMACYAVCPQKAIEITYDNEGFPYPNINLIKCIKCGKCIKNCEFKKNSVQRKSGSVYAVKHKTEEVRMASRSGGMFTAISDLILEKEGVIYGCILKDVKSAIHVRATTKEERDNMRGSKYIQSDTSSVFMKVRDDLLSDRFVLFSGTPCQVASLRSYLGSLSNSSRLILVDIVCHGVPSPLVWRDYVEWSEKKYKQVCTSAEFRDKLKFGWADHKETLYFGRNNISSNIFTKLFYAHNILRPSCFKCKYKSTERVGDITIGDYWGIEKINSDFNDNKGVSLVLVNTRKGEEIFELIKQDIEYIKCYIEDSLQEPLIKPFECPTEREHFWQDYNKHKFGWIIRNYVDLTIYARGKRKIKKFIRKIIDKS